MEKSIKKNLKIEVAKKLGRLPFIPIPNFKKEGTLFFIDNKFTLIIEVEEDEVSKLIQEL
jgi:hypothetical protein